MVVLVFFAICMAVGLGIGFATPSQATAGQQGRKTDSRSAGAQDTSAEREYLQARLVMLEDLQRRVEGEYRRATGKQAITYHRQMISLDDQIHKTMTKICKLEG